MTEEQQGLYAASVAKMRSQITGKAAAAAADGSQKGVERFLRTLGAKKISHMFTHLRKIAQHPLLVRSQYSDDTVAVLAKMAYERWVGAVSAVGAVGAVARALAGAVVARTRTPPSRGAAWPKLHPASCPDPPPTPPRPAPPRPTGRCLAALPPRSVCARSWRATLTSPSTLFATTPAPTSSSTASTSHT